MSQARESFLLVSSSILFFSLIVICGEIGHTLDPIFHGDFFVPIGILIGVVLGGILRFALFDYIYEKKTAFTTD